MYFLELLVRKGQFFEMTNTFGALGWKVFSDLANYWFVNRANA